MPNYIADTFYLSKASADTPQGEPLLQSERAAIGAATTHITVYNKIRWAATMEGGAYWNDVMKRLERITATGR